MTGTPSLAVGCPKGPRRMVCCSFLEILQLCRRSPRLGCRRARTMRGVHHERGARAKAGAAAAGIMGRYVVVLTVGLGLVVLCALGGFVVVHQHEQQTQVQHPQHHMAAQLRRDTDGAASRLPLLRLRREGVQDVGEQVVPQTRHGEGDGDRYEDGDPPAEGERDKAIEAPAEEPEQRLFRSDRQVPLSDLQQDDRNDAVSRQLQDFQPQESAHRARHHSHQRHPTATFTALASASDSRGGGGAERQDARDNLADGATMVASAGSSFNRWFPVIAEITRQAEMRNYALTLGSFSGSSGTNANAAPATDVLRLLRAADAAPDPGAKLRSVSSIDSRAAGALQPMLATSAWWNVLREESPVANRLHMVEGCAGLDGGNTASRALPPLVVLEYSSSPRAASLAYRAARHLPEHALSLLVQTSDVWSALRHAGTNGAEAAAAASATTEEAETSSEAVAIAYARAIMTGIPVEDQPAVQWNGETLPNFLHTVLDNPRTERQPHSFVVTTPKQCHYQALHNLGDFVGDLLPYEFEELIGAMLLQCRTSFLPEALPETRFFASWTSVEQLVQSALRAAHVPQGRATVTTVRSGSGSTRDPIWIDPSASVVPDCASTLSASTSSSSSSTTTGFANKPWGSSRSHSNPRDTARPSSSASSASTSTRHSSAGYGGYSSSSSHYGGGRGSSAAASSSSSLSSSSSSSSSSSPSKSSWGRGKFTSAKSSQLDSSLSDPDSSGASHTEVTPYAVDAESSTLSSGSTSSSSSQSLWPLSSGEGNGLSASSGSTSGSSTSTYGSVSSESSVPSRFSHVASPRKSSSASRAPASMTLVRVDIAPKRATAAAQHKRSDPPFVGSVHAGFSRSPAHRGAAVTPPTAAADKASCDGFDVTGLTRGATRVRTQDLGALLHAMWPLQSVDGSSGCESVWRGPTSANSGPHPAPSNGPTTHDHPTTSSGSGDSTGSSARHSSSTRSSSMRSSSTGSSSSSSSTAPDGSKPKHFSGPDSFRHFGSLTDRRHLTAVPKVVDMSSSDIASKVVHDPEPPESAEQGMALPQEEDANTDTGADADADADTVARLVEDTSKVEVAGGTGIVDGPLAEIHKDTEASTANEAVAHDMVSLVHGIQESVHREKVAQAELDAMRAEQQRQQQDLLQDRSNQDVGHQHQEHQHNGAHRHQSDKQDLVPLAVAQQQRTDAEEPHQRMNVRHKTHDKGDGSQDHERVREFHVARHLLWASSNAASSASSSYSSSSTRHTGYSYTHSGSSTASAREGGTNKAMKDQPGDTDDDARAGAQFPVSWSVASTGTDEGDVAAQAAIKADEHFLYQLQLTEDQLMPASAASKRESNTASARSGWDQDSFAGRRIARLVARERQSVAVWERLLQQEITHLAQRRPVSTGHGTGQAATSGSDPVAVNLFLSGDRVSLLSAKLGRRMRSSASPLAQRSLIVTHTSTHEHTAAHSSLLKMLRLHNVLPCTAQPTLPMLWALNSPRLAQQAATTPPFDIAAIQAPMVLNLVHLSLRVGGPAAADTNSKQQQQQQQQWHADDARSTEAPAADLFDGFLRSSTASAARSADAADSANARANWWHYPAFAASNEGIGDMAKGGGTSLSDWVQNVAHVEARDSFVATHEADCDLELLEAATALLLRLSSVNLVELPPFVQLHAALDAVLPRCAASFAERYMESTMTTESPEARFLRRVVTAATALERLNELDQSDGANEAPRLGRAMYRVQRLEAESSGDNPDTATSVIGGVFRIRRECMVASSAAAGCAAAADKRVSDGVSLHTLLHLGMLRSVRTRMMRMFVHLPLWAARATAEQATRVPPWRVNYVLRSRAGGFGAASGSGMEQGGAMHANSGASNAANRGSGASGTGASRHSGFAAPHQYGGVHANGGSHSGSFASESARDATGGTMQGMLVVFSTPHPREGDGAHKPTAQSGPAGSSFAAAQGASAAWHNKVHLWHSVQDDLTRYSADLANGRFSFADLGSGSGEVSLLAARAFPNATVLSVEASERMSNLHAQRVEAAELVNNLVCNNPVDVALFKNLYESPELLRFQLVRRSLLDTLLAVSAAADRAPPASSSSSSSLRSAARSSYHPSYASTRAGAGAGSSSSSSFGSSSSSSSAYKYGSGSSSSSSSSSRSGLFSSPSRYSTPWDDFGRTLGTMLSTALTSYFPMPPSQSISMALTTFLSAGFYAPYPSLLLGPAFVLEDSDADSHGHGRGAADWSHRSVMSVDEIAQLVASTAAATEESGGAGGRVSPGSLSGSTARSRGGNMFSSLLVHLSVSQRFLSPLAAFEQDAHPLPAWASLETRFISALAKTRSGSTEVAVSPLPPRHALRVPLVRVDITNMTRLVHHHFDYSKDGHKRTYTMHVSRNVSATAAALPVVGDPSAASLTEQRVLLPAVSASKAHAHMRMGAANTAGVPAIAAGAGGFQLPKDGHTNRHDIVAVYLTRDSDGSLIPYTSIHGLTLVAAMRLGLVSVQRDRAFKRFVALPLFEDMAPWNIVFFGPRLDYIDYDTKDVTYESAVPSAYQVMLVLANYKRTVSDLSRCGKKASVQYGLPYVGDCVGSGLFTGPCKDTAFPVPCGDGRCHSDYVSCLRSLLDVASQPGSTRESPVSEFFSPKVRTHADPEMEGVENPEKPWVDTEFGVHASEAEESAKQVLTQAMRDAVDTGRWRFDQSGLVESPSSHAAETAGRKRAAEARRSH